MISCVGRLLVLTLYTHYILYTKKKKKINFNKTNLIIVIVLYMLTTFKCELQYEYEI